MITLQELCLYLNNLLQPVPIQDYCVNGLQVEGQNNIHKIAFGVSANLKTIQLAKEWGATALVVHHGLFWNNNSHAITGVKKEKIKILIENGISLLAYHLPLDMHPIVGNNWKAARDLGWFDLEPFCSYKGHFLGVKGRFNPVKKEVFLKQLEDYYLHPAHAALGGKELFETGAIISGGSYKYLSEAIQDGLDCFIAGNFDEPAWSQAFEENIHFFAMGHSATERVGPIALCEDVKEKLHIECKFIDVPNPF